MDWKLPRPFAKSPIKHACFDHDGTLSTIRQGWETVMLPVMINAILGGHKPSDEVREAVEVDCKKFINETTGIQTIVQMVGLRNRVIGWGFSSIVKTPEEYKKDYNDQLMAFIRHRIADLYNHAVDPECYEINGASFFVDALVKRDVKPLIFSGTDQDDVIKEASLMRYGAAFAGNIYGSLGDVKYEVKREVLRRLLKEFPNPEQVVIFGDGPVEIREAKLHGCIAIGICNNESPQDWSHSKEDRLIDAGADVLLRNFNDVGNLLYLLGLTK